MSTKEEKLKHVSNSILVTCGNLLTYLYTNTSYKAVPNPPAQIQTAINGEIKQFQDLLDSIEIDVQSAIKYYTKKLESEQIKEQQHQEQQLKLKQEQELSNSQAVDAGGVGSSKSVADNSKNDLDMDNSNDVEDLFGESSNMGDSQSVADDASNINSKPSDWTGDAVNTRGGDSSGNKDAVGQDQGLNNQEDNHNQQNQSQNDDQDQNKDFTGDDAKLEGLLDSAFGSMDDRFDNFDDFNRLIDDANAQKVDGQNPDDKDLVNANLLDDDVGLFGANFDFMMPSDDL